MGPLSKSDPNSEHSSRYLRFKKPKPKPASSPNAVDHDTLHDNALKMMEGSDTEASSSMETTSANGKFVSSSRGVLKMTWVGLDGGADLFFFRVGFPIM